MLRGVDLNKYKLLEHILKAYWISHHVSSSLESHFRIGKLILLIFIQGISRFLLSPRQDYSIALIQVSNFQARIMIYSSFGAVSTA
jgi:hypothetical protein